MSFGMALLVGRGGGVILPQVPTAVGDSRNIGPGETSVVVNVLANDLNVGGATVMIQGAVTGANAVVVGSAVHVTRIGTAAGSYSLTYRATTAAGFSDAILSGTIAAALVAPTAVNDQRNLTATEISVLVDVLANDSNVSGAVVTIQGAVTGATAAVEADGQTIRVTRIGTAAGSYSLTYRATTDGGFDEVTLFGTIDALQEVSISAFAGTTASPGAEIDAHSGTTASPGGVIPIRAGTS